MQPLLILSPCWGPQEGRGYVATSDYFTLVGNPEKAGVIQPLLISSPYWRPPKQQVLCRPTDANHTDGGNTQPTQDGQPVCRKAPTIQPPAMNPPATGP